MCNQKKIYKDYSNLILDTYKKKNKCSFFFLIFIVTSKITKEFFFYLCLFEYDINSKILSTTCFFKEIANKKFKGKTNNTTQKSKKK